MCLDAVQNSSSWTSATTTSKHWILLSSRQALSFSITPAIPVPRPRAGAFELCPLVPMLMSAAALRCLKLSQTCTRLVTSRETGQASLLMQSPNRITEMRAMTTRAAAPPPSAPFWDTALCQRTWLRLSVCPCSEHNGLNVLTMLTVGQQYRSQLAGVKNMILASAREREKVCACSLFPFATTSLLLASASISTSQTLACLRPHLLTLTFNFSLQFSKQKSSWHAVTHPHQHQHQHQDKHKHQRRQWPRPRMGGLPAGASTARLRCRTFHLRGPSGVYMLHTARTRAHLPRPRVVAVPV